jgi:NTP pyrophosphatase (non-canonical NTP hydrolase)
MSVSQLVLPDDPTLKDYQNYITTMVAERGFTEQTLPVLVMLLVEEVGELAKVARKMHGHSVDELSKISTAEDELADVLIYVLALANEMKVDLELAFRAKEEKNKQRVWS